MKRSFAVAALSIGLLTVGCSDAVSLAGPSSVRPGTPASAGAAQSLPFKGKLEGTQTITLQPPLAFVNGSATGTASLLGRFTVSFPHTVNFALATGEGTYTFTAANGDLLIARFVGQAQQGPIVSIVEQATITGGTGRFSGATGSFTAHRQFDPVSGTTTGSFEGTVSFSGSGKP